MELFRAGCPAWRVVHMVNRGLRTAGAQLPSLVLLGDPFVSVERAVAPDKVSIDGASIRSPVFPPSDAGDNISEAARRLGIHRRSLLRQLQKYPPSKRATARAARRLHRRCSAAIF